ncbi:MAG: CDP-glycerol glycerophosphotransferase family protein [Candidatus Gastranaerophilales bacterium]|nr:CDP-glycerol glycerophosphotransferase family protein [Candidatus Gastranaerophilales bacterium]
MYIPYDFLYQKISIKFLKDFFYKKKIKQNCNYISKNRKKVLKRIKNKEILNVVFYVYDCSKWKCQSLYEKLELNEKFKPLIVVTKNSAKNSDNPSYQTKEEIIKTYEFFKNKNMNVGLGYDFKKNQHIPFKTFRPDIIIYQHPWYVETKQGPVVCSKFALTFYVPYNIPTTNLESDCNLRFHQYVQTYYLAHDILKEEFSALMDNKGENLKVVGAPSFDLLKKAENKKYVIYAPHWTVNHKKTIAYSTFKEYGEFILEYAKNHPEFNWVFKPHPLLKKAIIDNNLMSINEVEKYYQAWNEIGIVCEDGSYYEIFNNSKLMITDCSTFLIEYLMSENPLIDIVSFSASKFNKITKEITKTYYKPENINEFIMLLDKVLIQNNDYLLEERRKVKNKFLTNASEKILEDLLTYV